MKLTVCLSLVFATGSFAYPVSQPLYQNTQYISAQAIPNVQYRQQPQVYLQPQYISAPAQTSQTAKPVYEADKSLGLQKYSTQIKQPIQQVLLSTNVDRQIQRVAQVGGPQYLQQIQSVQQQSQAQQAFDAAQRKATSLTFGGQAQPIPIPQPVPQQHHQQQQQQQQPHYLRALNQPSQLKFGSPAGQGAPVAQGYRHVAQPQQQAQQDQQNPEEYDSNPSYQFGFDVNDDLYTNYQNRKEQREGNKITGSYSVVDSDGFVRTVTYTADPKEGFKAEVTRQPTDIVVKVPKPDPQFQRQPQQQYGQQQLPVQQKIQGQEQKPNLIQYQYQ